jgi:hypothetical protein
MTLCEMLHDQPELLPDLLDFTADAALQRACEAVGYVLVAHTIGRRASDPVTGQWVQIGLDRMVMQRRAPSSPSP